MKQYKKPLMKIVELEKVDVLTASCKAADCSNEAANDSEYCQDCIEKQNAGSTPE